MKKVIVGMSGGVDSSVTAAKLIEQGYEVIGVTARVWDLKKDPDENVGIDDAGDENNRYDAGDENNRYDAGDENNRYDAGDENNRYDAGDENNHGNGGEIAEAERVCKALGIEHHIIDMQNEFKCSVMDYFVTEYCHGCTPNPCNMCNCHIKWKALLDAADKFGADYIATGHYAKIISLPNGRYTIANAASAVKDQTYALCFLSQEQLAKTLMPLGDYTKEQVREVAKEMGLPVAEKKDSQDICFIPDKDYRKFIDTYIEENGDRKAVSEVMEDYRRAVTEGNFVDVEGRVLGKHKGMLQYTYGQRRGLGVSAKTRLCVIDMNEKNGNITLAEDEKAYSDSLVCRDVSWMAVDGIDKPTVAFAKIRYAHKGEKATIIPEEGNRLAVKFDNPVRAITPGQPVVFYEDDHILGAGIIDKA